MKVIFFISRLFWQDEVFALLQFAHDCDFCQKLAAPQAFQCQQKTDRTAWQLVRSGMLENRLISSFRCFLDLLFQRFSWSPPFRYIVGVTLADIPFPFLFSKSESALRRIQLCQLLENSISPPAAPSQDINTPDINSCVSLALGKVDWPIIKTPILFPPPPLHFSKISNFFFGPRPSLQKQITNANTNTKIIFWRQTKDR